MPTLRGVENGSVLIVDDDLKLRRVLHAALSKVGFEVTGVANGEKALQQASASAFDAVVLDVNMPGIGGIEACRRLRELRPSLQILMLTVRDSERDKVDAFEAGADDFVTKPFSLPELVARLRAAVRRATATGNTPAGLIVIGEVEIDLQRRAVRKSRTAVHLTPTEFDLLDCLMSSAGLPLGHPKLLQAIWGPEYGEELGLLRVAIHGLRQKLEDDPASPRYILTEAHFGYRFREP